MLFLIIAILFLSSAYGKQFLPYVIGGAVFYLLVLWLPGATVRAEKRQQRKEERAARRSAKRAAKLARKAANAAPVYVPLQYSPSAPVSHSADVLPDYDAPQESLTVWPVCDDILDQAHVLIGGTTGAGKSTFAHSIIYSLCASNPYARSFYGIDLKRVELSCWRSAPHCRGIAITPQAALDTLDTVSDIVDFRLGQMEQDGERLYSGGDLYLIIDELAELLSVNRKAVVDKLSRIMRLGRAARVHVIGFTQAPNRSKGGGLDPQLCQNFTAAVALRCRSAIESRQIVGVSGAELLPKHGSGIYWSGDGIREIGIPMTSDNDIKTRAHAWKAI